MQLAVLEGRRLGVSRLDLWNFDDVKGGIDLNRGQSVVQAHREDVLSGRIHWARSPNQADRKMKLFRPLPSLSVLVDHALWGMRSVPFHVSTLVLFLVSVLVAALFMNGLFARAIETPRRHLWLALALALFVCDPLHAEVMSRFACRHLVLATIFGLVALSSHIHWRTSGWQPGRWLSILGWILAALSSENWLQGFGLLVAYELFGTEPNRRKRIFALLPALGVLVAYLVVYAQGGYGITGVAGYLDPVGRPIDMLATLPKHVWALVVEQTLGLKVVAAWFGAGQAQLSFMRADGRWRFSPTVVAGLSVLTLCTLGLYYWSFRRANPEARRQARWLFVGALVALVPSGISQPGTRGLFLPGLVWSFLTVCLVRDLVQPSKEAVRRWYAVTAAVAICLFRGTLSAGALLLVLQRYATNVTPSWNPPPPSQSPLSACPEARQDRSADGGLIALVAPLLEWPGLPSEARTAALPRGCRRLSTDLWILASLPAEYEMYRASAFAFELSLVGKPSRTIPFTMAFSSRGEAEEVELRHGIKIRILEGRNGAITRIRVELPMRLEDSPASFVIWREGMLRPVALPGVGEHVRFHVS